MAQPQFVESHAPTLAYPPDALRAVSRSRACLGLIGQDGRIEALNRAALTTMGFSTEDDLSGLAVLSLWTFPERLVAESALVRARRGESVTLDLDLTPFGGAPCSATLSRCADGLVLLRIDCPD